MSHHIGRFAALACAVTITAALAAAPASGTALSTLKFDATFTSVHNTDVAPKGASAGDAFQYTDKLTRGGKTQGRDAGSCVHTDKVYFQCDVTITLPGGTIQAEGLGHDTNAAIGYAITGGTGRYAFARGTFTITDSTKNLAHYLLRFRLG